MPYFLRSVLTVTLLMLSEILSVYAGDSSRADLKRTGHNSGDLVTVNDDLSEPVRRQFAAAADKSSDGRSIVVWSEIRTSVQMPFVTSLEWRARLFNSDNTPSGLSFLINDEEQNFNSTPGASAGTAFSSDGGFLVVWQDNRSSFLPGYFNTLEIYAQRYGSDGVPIGPNVMVADFNEPALYPSVEWNEYDSTFLVVWCNSYPGLIRARRLDPHGQPLGAAFTVSNVPAEWAWEPTVASLGVNGWVIAWSSGHDCNLGCQWGIRAQWYDTSCAPVGSVKQVADSLGDAQYPTIVSIGSGQVVLAWNAYLQGIQVRAYDSSRSAVRPAVRASDSTIALVDGNPIIYEDSGQTFSVLYRGHTISTDSLRYRDYVWLQTLDLSLNPSGQPKLVSDHRLSQAPIVGTGGPVHGAMVAWTDGRNEGVSDGNLDVYAQALSTGGMIQGPNFRVHDDLGTGDHRRPRMACSDSTAIIVWEDLRANCGRRNVYSQRLGAIGNLVGSNTKINGDTAPDDDALGPQVAANGVGHYAICWFHARHGNEARTNLLVRAFDESGNSISDSQRVNENMDQASAANESKIAMDQSGRFAVVWVDRGPLGPEPDKLYLRLYNPSGTPIGFNHIINEDRGPESIFSPDVVWNSNGEVWVIWQERNAGSSIAFVQRFHSDGTINGANVVIPLNTSARALNALPSTLGQVILTWQSTQTPGEVWSELLDSQLVPQNSPVQLTDSSDFRSYRASLDNGGRLLIMWGSHMTFSGKLIDLPDWSTVGRIPSILPDPDSVYQGDFDAGLSGSTIWLTWEDLHDSSGARNIRATVIDPNATGADFEPNRSLPTTFLVHQNFPNPFNPSTTIRYALPARSSVVVEIYNIMGQRVRSIDLGEEPVGDHSIAWDGTNDSREPVASGVYLYRVTTQMGSKTKKMLLVK